jgi:cephalosporin-C deacetylase-like acetyl esterase
VESPNPTRSGIFEHLHGFLRLYPEHTDTVMDVLTYFDIINMVSLLKVPTEFCLALADPICLPPFVYSAYAHTTCEKKIYMYPFTPHEVPIEYKRQTHREFAAM